MVGQPCATKYASAHLCGGGHSYFTYQFQGSVVCSDHEVAWFDVPVHDARVSVMEKVERIPNVG